MVQSTTTDACWATAGVNTVEGHVEAALDWLRPRLLDWARAMQEDRLTPAVFFQLELHLVVLLRDFGRLLLELLLNGREGDGGLLPHDLLYEGQGYRRLGKKTRNAHVATLFGTIGLLVCYDVEGREIWRTDVGVLDSGWLLGARATPVPKATGALP